MNEQDLAVARAIAAESKESSPGGSPGPLRKTVLTNLADKLNTFRYVRFYKTQFIYFKLVVLLSKFRFSISCLFGKVIFCSIIN